MAVVSDILARRMNSYDAVMIDIGEPRLRLEIGVFNLLRLVGLLDDDVGSGEALFDITLPNRNMLYEITRRVVVYDGRPFDHGFVGIKHRRKHLVFDADLCNRPPCRGEILRGNGNDRLSDIANLVARHHRLIAHEDAKSILAGDIGGGDDPLDARYRCRVGDVDRYDARMRVRASQHLHMQHVWQHHVAGIAQRAGHLGRRIDTANVDANVFAVVGVQLIKGRLRQLSVKEIPRHLNGVEYLLITGAPADVSAKTLFDFFAVGVGIEAQRSGRGHHHAGDAIAALTGARLVKGLLDRRHFSGGRKTLDGIDLPAGDLGDRQKA